jgi:hypothetical protein
VEARAMMAMQQRVMIRGTRIVIVLGCPSIVRELLVVQLLSVYPVMMATPEQVMMSGMRTVIAQAS